MSGNPSVYTTTLPSPHSYPLLPTDHKTDESSEIRCICGFTHDDGFTIACDQCDTWQHGFCVDIAEDRVPDRYECPSCFPRPLDVRKATEYQKNRNDREEKPRRKKQKSTATTHQSRKKDASNNLTLTNGPGPPVITDKVVGTGKSHASKESQQSRKRGSNHRTSLSTNSAPTTGYYSDILNGAFAPPAGPLTPNAPSPAMTVATANAEDSDTEMDRPYDFTDLTDGRDHYANKEVQNFVNGMAVLPEDDTVRRLTMEQISSSLPGLSVTSIPGNSRSYSISQHFITVDAPCPRGQLVALCKGDIVFQQAYKADAINQYSILRHPKPCVFFHQSQPICIDSRIRGSLARFVKRSCRANTTLSTIIVNGSEVIFGLFATELIKAKTTLTVEWEWSGSQAMQRLLNGADPEQLDHEEYQDALCWVNNLTEHMGGCACVDKDECIFNKLRIKRETSTPKPFSPNTRTRQGSRATQGFSSTPVSDHPSPDRQASSDRENGKSQSRDRSPSIPMHEELSVREARKMQEILSRFEKIEQGDQQSTNSKRRKRNNTVSAAAGEPLPKVEGGRKVKSSSTAMSPPPSTSRDSSETITAPVPSRSSSDSISVKSEDSRAQMQPPPAPIKRIKKPDYVESGMQTDECEGAWWTPAVPEAPPRPSPVSLKERLMQSMLRERKKASLEAARESKKRKQSEISDEGSCAVESYKEIKMTEDSDVKSVAKSPSTPTTDIHVAEAPRELVNTPPESGVEIPLFSAPQSDVKPLVPPAETQPRGPALADIFADSPPPPAVQEPIMDNKRTPPISPKTVAVDFHSTPRAAGRPFGLQVQLPTGPAFPTAPTTPSPMPPSATSPAPVTPGAQTHSPLALSATAPNFPLSALTSHGSSQMNSMATPAKTKKLSLSEYGNRRKKVDYIVERDKKLAMSAVTEETTMNAGHTDGASPPTTTTSS